MKIRKVIRSKTPLKKVFAYLSDFTSTTDWDPGTVVTTRVQGNNSVGTEYRNTSTFAGRQTQLTYIVVQFIPDQMIRLRGENKTVVAIDTMTFQQVGEETEVTYTAEFSFKGITRFLALFLKPAFVKLGNQAEVGMAKALDQL